MKAIVTDRHFEFDHDNLESFKQMSMNIQDIVGQLSKKTLHMLIIFALLLSTVVLIDGCAYSIPRCNADEQTNKTQFMLQVHNIKNPIIEKTTCISTIEDLLDSITGMPYVFIGYAPKPWITGGKQAQFSPYRSNEKLIVTVVINDFCRIEGLVWSKQ